MYAAIGQSYKVCQPLSRQIDVVLGSVLNSNIWLAPKDLDKRLSYEYRQVRAYDMCHFRMLSCAVACTYCLRFCMNILSALSGELYCAYLSQIDGNTRE